jgi:hypothetical protein
MRKITALTCAALLSGCASVSQKDGDTTMRGLFTNLTAASKCTEYNSDGSVASATENTITTSGDTSTLGAAGTILNSLLSFVVPFLPAPTPRATRGSQDGRRGAVSSSPGADAVTGCNGEKTTLAHPSPPPEPPAPMTQ